jgi:hypothetical protein
MHFAGQHYVLRSIHKNIWRMGLKAQLATNFPAQALNNVPFRPQVFLRPKDGRLPALIFEGRGQSRVEHIIELVTTRTILPTGLGGH